MNGVLKEKTTEKKMNTGKFIIVPPIIYFAARVRSSLHMKRPYEIISHSRPNYDITIYIGEF